MATSLAEQLKKLAVPQTTLLTRDKKRPSLLFDPKEAANLDKATVYQIGRDGLTELKGRNIIFAQFESTLFHPSSKQFERAVQTAESNTLLNNNIKKFLLLLSPYFLFNCSYKALEWLVYRYSIHDYNKEDLLTLILPYHETNIFVRALQLLNLDEPNEKWGWLKSLQRPGIHLPKQTLYNRAASDMYFIQFVSNFVLAMIKEHENPSNLVVVFNFYCTTFTGAIEYSNEINEGHVSQMLPVILQGLRSEIPDFTAATYVITAKILIKTQLTDKILKRLVERTSEINVVSLSTEAALLLVVLYQSQKQFKVITELALRNLSNRGGFVKALQGLNSDGINIYPFLEALLSSGIKAVIEVESREVYGKFVDGLMDQVKIQDSFVETIFLILLDLYKPEESYSESTISWLKEFIKKIERQYPHAYDANIKKLMQLTDKTTTIKKKQVLGSLVDNLSNMQDWYDVFEKLYHPAVDVRREGIKMLSKKFSSFLNKEKEVLQNALVDRLNDDKRKVVHDTLVIFRNKFTIVIEPDHLCNVLIKLLSKCQAKGSKWTKTESTVLNVLCENFKDDNIHVFVAVLPYLLPTNQHDTKIAKQIISSNYGQTSKFLKGITLDNDHKQLFKQILMNCEINGQISEVTKLLKGLQQVKDLNQAQKYLVMLLITECLPEQTDPELNNLVLDIFEIFLENSEIVSVEKGEIIDFLKVVRDEKLPLEGYLNCMETVIKKAKVEGDLSRLDFNNSGRFFLRVLNILVKHKQLSLECTALAMYFEVFCRNSVETLLNIVISNAKEFSSSISCLNLINLLIKTQDNVENITPYVLVALTSSNNKIRKKAIQIVGTLTTLKATYTPFLIELLENQEEILLDHEQLPLIIFNLMSMSQFPVVLDNLKQLLNKNYPTYFKSGIVTILSLITDRDTYENIAKSAVAVLNNTVENKLNMPESAIVSCNVTHINPGVATQLSEQSDIWAFLELCLKSDKTATSDGTKTTPVSVLVLNQIDRLVFAALSVKLQTLLLEIIVEVASLTQNPEVTQACNHVFKRIDLDASLVLKPLQVMRDAESVKVTSRKRNRRVVIPTVDILELLEWRKGITVLENIQAKKKIRNTTVILGVLFEVLKKCLDFDEQAAVEYPKQLILSSILHCCNKVENERIPESVFNMQLVVQCIRASPNPQTHHHALLLLAQTASIMPKQVLHNIIAIFTFVGSSVLRHDDAYSFQIIAKIIDTVIPILIQDGTTESIATVLRVFTDAILDVPEHRRLPLFKQLLTCLDVKENLYIFLLLIFESHVVHSHTEKLPQKNSNFVTPKRLDIASDLCYEFPPENVLITFIKIIQYLRKLPEEKNEQVENPDTFTFDIKRYTPKQFRHYKYIIITFTSGFLASPTFVKQIAELPDDTSANLESVYKDFILHMLNHIQETCKISERNANTVQSQYWKVLLHHSYDILDAVNALLSSKMFLLVIRGLMVFSLSNVRKRALDLLSNKLQHNPAFFDDCDDSELYDTIVTPLVAIVKSSDKVEAEPDLEVVIQKALLSLKLLVRRLASNNPQKFTPILDLIAELVKKVKQENLTASLILCIAELCANLKAHSISSLHKFVPTLIKLLKNHKRLDFPNLLLVTDIAAIHKILDALPLFLSPYIEKLLHQVALISVKWPQSDDPKLSQFLIKLDSIQKKIGTIVALRVLLPAIDNSYKTLAQKQQFAAVQPLMTILSNSLSNLKGSDIQGNLTELTSFFISALESSNRNSEEYIIQALVTLILKLSESSFRPLYYKFYDWAVRTNTKSDRVITFYNMSKSFANNLKGLFVLFAGHFLNNAAALLDACNTLKSTSLYFDDDSKNLLLVENILKTLNAIFMYDSQKFVNKERFEVLMQPLVDQIENTLGAVDSIKPILTSCLVQFAVATADDSLWKQMNYQILLKMRHNSPTIRLNALECLSEIAKKLGEDFLPLLPETIPFLAELLEDEDEAVEKACQKSVQELEKVLGEPLQKYF